MNKDRVFLSLGLLLVAFHVPAFHSQAAPPPSPATAHNANFVVSAPSRELAEEVLAQADALRDALAVQWLGQKLPPGIGSAVIRVQLSDTEDRGLTWPAERAERLTHMMWLTTSRQRALGSTLAHEMTHVVLATRYPGQIPAWCNEGIASLVDDEDRCAARRQILAWFAETGNWPALVRVLDTDKIAPTDPAQYAVSASLTQYLLTLGDGARLLEFARSGKRLGWDSALRKHYDITNARVLQAQWQAWAKN